MADYEINVSDGLLSNLMTEQDGLAQLLESVLNQVLEVQASEQIGAERYERSETRTAYRNGLRLRQLYTRVGPLTLRVPQFRDGSFSTEIFTRYQRSEQAFVLALMEMVVNGVSSRKVTKITEALCGASFSKSTVSRLCTVLDARLKAFNERPLGSFSFLIVDAMMIKVRKNYAVVSKGRSGKRCQVHFMRNVLSHTASKHKKVMAEGLKHILNADSAKEARQRFETFSGQMGNIAVKAMHCLENGLEDALAVMALPSKYRRRLKSTNMQERLIQEVRRRERVIRIFPNEASALRLIGALLAEIHEDWQTRCYLEMTEFNEWQAEQKNKKDTNIVQIK
ncbi:MAG: transposase [Nitrospiria bacterium]